MLPMEIKLEQVGRMAGRPAGGGGLAAGKAQLRKIQAVHAGVNEAGRAPGRDIIFQRGRQKLGLGALKAANMFPNVYLTAWIAKYSKFQRVFTQPVKLA